MKYFRTKDKIICFQDDVYILTKDIVDAGYGKVLPKGTMVVLGKQWWNYYGKWQRIYEFNSNGIPYDISPKEARDSLSKIEGEKDKLEDLCDYWMYRNAFNDYIIKPVNGGGSTKESLARSLKKGMVREIKLGILTDKGLLYVAKMNEKGGLELL